MKKHYLNLVLLWALMFIAAGSYAQQTSSQEYAKDICDNQANTAVRLGLDVVGTDLNINGGTWHLVDNSLMVGDLNTYAGVNDSRYLEEIQGGVFVLVGKPIGTYTFVYTATNNACLAQGTKIIARINLIKTAENISTRLFTCGSDYTLKVRDLLGSEIAGDASFDPLSGVNLNGGVEPSFHNTPPYSRPDESIIIPVGWEGTIVLPYYNINSPCDNRAEITIDVVSNNVDNISFPTSPLEYCVDVAPDNVNLTSITNVVVNGGSWSVKSGVTGAIVNGDYVTFEDFTQVALPKTYTFVYTYDDCSQQEHTMEFAIKIADAITLTDITDDVCRSSNPNQVYDLMRDGLGLGLQNTAGTWDIVSQPSGNANLSVTDGLFNLRDAKIGQYQFLFRASNAANLCGATGTATLTVNLGDVSGSSISDGQVNMCWDVIRNQSSSYLTLSDYVTGLSSVGNVTWSGPSGVTLQGDQIQYQELENLYVGTHRFSFEYTSAGCNGVNDTGTGDLYVTLTSDINLGDVTLNYCRPDLPVSGINLNQALGADIPGTWEIDLTTPNDVTAANLNNGVFTETANVTGEKTYIMKFTPASDTCNSGTNPVYVTIVVRDDSFN